MTETNTAPKKKRVTKKAIESQLDKLYSCDPYSLKLENKDEFDDERHAVYGEASRDTVDRIIETFSKKLGKTAVFYDLGCGHGKMVSHIALKTKAKKVVGIELSKERYEKALELCSDVEFHNTQPAIINADFMNEDLSDATVVYIDNTMYEIDVLNKLAQKLPKGCLLVYKHGGQKTGDRFLPFGTSYNKVSMLPKDSLAAFWMCCASYRYV